MSKKSRKLLAVSIQSYRFAGFSEIQHENVEHYHVMNEDWKCIEMELLKV